jgi:hypothetical protein
LNLSKERKEDFGLVLTRYQFEQGAFDFPRRGKFLGFGR